MKPPTLFTAPQNWLNLESVDTTITLALVAVAAAAAAVVQACMQANVPTGWHVLFTSTSPRLKHFRHRRQKREACVTPSIYPSLTPFYNHFRDLQLDAASLSNQPCCHYFPVISVNVEDWATTLANAVPASPPPCTTATPSVFSLSSLSLTRSGVDNAHDCHLTTYKPRLQCIAYLYCNSSTSFQPRASR